ncbi:MAG: SUMF1/EgtB/PvdO family nonheme iron enzyme [bacterium]|nr:SUMF1/EgtB/PvdO family nonheme iron enzyme [bacterium]
MRDEHPQGAEPRTVEEAFAQFVMRHEAGEAEDPKSYCARYPALRGELEHMISVWLRLQGILDSSPGGSEEPDAPEPRHGEVDVPGDESYSNEVVDRLSERGGGFERYRMEGEIARGGMAAIMRVWDGDLRRHLAMKVILAKGEGKGASSGTPSRSLARFLEEAQVTGQLDHPGIVPIHELGLDQRKQVYFTMKLVKGHTLRDTFDLVRTGGEGWTQARALRVVLKICEAMAYAHSKGVEHRDLKPAKVMVGRFGEVYVMDWGLARILGRKDVHDTHILVPDPTSEVHSERREHGSDGPDSPLITLDGHVVGTPAYMSPEQARARLDDVGPRSDVYAVGAILYHLLSGHPPYLQQGVVAGNHAIWRWVQEGPPASLHAAAPTASGELIAIAEKAMERDPSARYADMEQLAHDLEAFLEDRVVQAYEIGSVAELRKWVTRNRPLASAIAAGAALVLVGFFVSTGLYLRAERGEALAQARAADVLRLSAIQDLRGLESRADELWPAYPEHVDALNLWLADADELLARIPDLRRVLVDLRLRAQPWSPEEVVRDRETHLRAGELREARNLLVRWQTSAASYDEDTSPSAREHAQREIDEVEARIAELEEFVAVRSSFTLDDPDEKWWHDQIAGLLADVQVFEGPGGLHQEVRERLAFARDVGELTIEGAAARAAWNEAIASISDLAECPLYGGLEISPQLGLLPLWRHPKSGLWEFAHLQTGAVPTFDEDEQRALIDESTGLVFVLLPGGAFSYGAQSTDPDGANYDPSARPDEKPVRELSLDPFFASKYELTQAQWKRFWNANPSLYYDGFWVMGSRFGSINGLHPVEQVNWEECDELVRRLDLALPTAAQWEYLARSGTQGPWCTGAEADSLRGYANLADEAAHRSGASWPSIDRGLGNDDGYPVHAPVSAMRAGPWGLFHVHGNVAEWCSDGYGGMNLPLEAGDGRITGADMRFRVWRGGAYNHEPFAARSSHRGAIPFDVRNKNLGLRPVRRIR